MYDYLMDEFDAPSAGAEEINEANNHNDGSDVEEMAGIDDESGEETVIKDNWTTEYSDWERNSNGIPRPPPNLWQGHVENGARLHCRVIGYGEGEQERRQIRRFKLLVTKPIELCDEAYAPVSNRNPIRTIFGHLQIYSTLKRVREDRSSNDEGENENDNSLAAEPLFEMTLEHVAIKVNLKQAMDRLQGKGVNENPHNEISFLQLLREDEPQNNLPCRNIIFDQETNTFNFVLPFHQGGDLWNRIFFFRRGMPERETKIYMKQIIQGLMELRRLGLAHRDLSPENILLAGDQQENVILIDYGQTHRVPYQEEIDLEQNEPATVDSILYNTVYRPEWHRYLTQQLPVSGKLPYMSPERYYVPSQEQKAVLRSSFDGELSDVWSAGVVMFVMLTGQPSYRLPHPICPRFNQITQQLESFFTNIPISSEALFLLKQMLEVNVEQRWTLEQVRNYTWFEDIGFPQIDDDDMDI